MNVGGRTAAHKIFFFWTGLEATMRGASWDGGPGPRVRTTAAAVLVEGTGSTAIRFW